MYTKETKQPFDLLLQEMDSWEALPYAHNFFELIYIREGKGSITVNNNSHAYTKENIFLLTPTDKYHFDIEDPTQFLFIRFTDLSFSRFEDETAHLEFCDWTKKTQYLFNNLQSKTGSLFRSEADAAFGNALLTAIVREYQQQEAGYQLVLRQSVTILLNILARNVSLGEPARLQKKTPKNDIIQIVGYIQQHIHAPELLKIKVMAAHFHFSQNYLGAYFRERTGESIQDYVINYKLKLVETRLAHSNMRISEIAEELHFTDESYLSRLFKKYRGMTPGAYRKMLAKV
ncbi:AraC family transcriptional regulator [Chitinophaga nivalis]|uniref:AraC family transcriptional regulator n=1 Tax=Chitinophaga nivalis TaxID=2991709 RepID=A0ABT3IIE2_9BACT|nr:AraC family transcriptional regulator [Chitinophaga nivalis]MCW3466605.1 AraC family transcriptional regulator [Chitinophaga nivalis]MCW3483704.1 AraC family transcriptional regulator [Chitinophaga nivalis]